MKIDEKRQNIVQELPSYDKESNNPLRDHKHIIHNYLVEQEWGDDSEFAKQCKTIYPDYSLEILRDHAIQTVDRTPGGLFVSKAERSRHVFNEKLKEELLKKKDENSPKESFLNAVERVRNELYRRRILCNEKY